MPLEKRFLGIFTAYLDESGTHKTSSVVVVAGFISDASRWENFTQEWKEALDDYHLAYFHMTDFENKRGQFKGWNGQERKNRLNRFLGIIKKYALYSMGWAVPRQPFDAILSEPAKAICVDAYGLAAIGCFRSFAQIAVDPRVDGWGEYVMESGARGSGALLKIFNIGSEDPEWLDNNRIKSLTFQDKRLFLPLQAADILAYELYKQLPRQLGMEGRQIRYPLKQLVTPIKDWHYTDDAELRSINEWLSRPRHKHIA